MSRELLDKCEASSGYKKKDRCTCRLAAFACILWHSVRLWAGAEHELLRPAGEERQKAHGLFFQLHPSFSPALSTLSTGGGQARGMHGGVCDACLILNSTPLRTKECST